MEEALTVVMPMTFPASRQLGWCSIHQRLGAEARWICFIKTPVMHVVHTPTTKRYSWLRDVKSEGRVYAVPIA